MAEYIEREKLIEDIKNDCCELVYYTKADAIDCIKSAHAADVAPVVRGRWEPHKDYLMERSGFWECSSCRKMARDTTEYCPNCGAKMDKEE